MLAQLAAPKGLTADACQSASRTLDHDMTQDTSAHISPELFGKADDTVDMGQSDSGVFLDLHDDMLVVDCTALCTWVALWSALGHRVLSPLRYHSCTSHLPFLGMDSNCLCGRQTDTYGFYILKSVHNSDHKVDSFQGNTFSCTDAFGSRALSHTWSHRGKACDRACALCASHNDTASPLLVCMFHKDLGGNAVNTYGFHIQVFCHSCLHKLVHLLYKAKKTLISDKDRTSSQIEDTLHKHQHGRLAHMYDSHMAVSFHILDHSATLDSHNFFLLLFCHIRISVY